MHPELPPHDWDEIIDQYLLGTIPSELKETLESRMQKDPDMARRVQESQRAFEVIRYARQRQLRDQMLAWDRTAMESRRPGKRMWVLLSAIVAILLTLTIIGLICLSPVRLAMRYCEPQCPIVAGSVNENEINRLWDEATRSFTHRDFDSAILLYAACAGMNGTDLSDAASWNILLAGFAKEGPTPSWRNRLNTFARQARQPYRAKADHLGYLLDHPVFRHFIHIEGWPVTVFQPQIM